MFTPPFARSIASQLSTYTVNSNLDLANHFQSCNRKEFSGRLDLSVLNSSEPMWSFFFHLGQLVWSVGELHPRRRWHRQLAQYCPNLAAQATQQSSPRLQPWNYGFLVNMLQRGQLQHSNLSAIVIGNILELLFDVIQAVHSARHSAELHLTYCSVPTDSIPSELLVTIDPERAWRRAEQAWSIWQQSGLSDLSPNLAPVIYDDEELRRQTSLLVYHNLTSLAMGCWTLRDIAVKLKQPLAPLTRSLLPYVNQGVIGLDSIEDLQFEQKPARPPLIAYIEDSRFDSAAMRQILSQAGYGFVSIRDAMQAIPMLLEHKPNLIFLDLLMPIANGYEVCTQIRRVTAFQDIPIVILTSSDGIVDRVRAKLVGASGFLAKPIESGKIINALQQYLPKSVQNQWRNTS